MIWVIVNLNYFFYYVEALIEMLIKPSKVIIPLSILFISSLTLAVEPTRKRTPIVSGTELLFPQEECTAGLVVRKTGLFNNATAYQRAVRYVVTAGHCGRLNDEVRVGTSDIRNLNPVVGKVIWKSDYTDLELIKIEPVRHNATHCSAPSTGMTCNIIVTYDPIASGKLIVSKTGITVSVRGTGIPGPNEVFCTSGAVTSINCSWGKVPSPPGWAQPAHPERNQSAETTRANVEGGDSGGPVSSFGTRGLIYGIISSKGMHWGNHPNYMDYVPIDQFFTEQPGYEIAP